MIDALIAGERDVEVMAEMALTRMRPKIAELRLALDGRFDDHHALMLRLHLRHIDQLTAAIERARPGGRHGDSPLSMNRPPAADTIPGIGHGSPRS